MLTNGFSNFEENPLNINDSSILSHIVDPKKNELKFYWKDKNGNNYKNFQNLKSDLERQNKKLIFAMNAGMFQVDLKPLGLFIENGIQKHRLNKVQNAYGNFYLQPNGVFYLTKENKAVVCPTKNFQINNSINYATQSGPMLLIDGKIHSKLTKGSKNLNIRNGVGVLPNGDLLFAMSKTPINFYDFASFFKKNGCKNALYLDGAISKTYLPSKNWKQMNGTLGVIIAETEQL